MVEADLRQFVELTVSGAGAWVVGRSAVIVFQVRLSYVTTIRH